ncbi:MAG: biotin--[acetyl-CoA-carboxylase] ligase [Bacteroidales bacterium]|jgi:BirA family biotin operon repressor/biotin-[acetyl-CoA-carboxylase] ligase|nr:biotin--[acetyl-CoA-carboxylase] ligase [Bacteroidales bacterium]
MIIGSNIIFYAKLDSTNTVASSILKTCAPDEGTVIRAGFQTAGKGQVGSRWESEDGQNMLITTILYPQKIQAADQFLVSMAISLGVSDFVSGHTQGCKIKWPNDIYVFNSKIAGILIENSVMNGAIVDCIAGIGVNINQEAFAGDAPNPVSLKQITGCSFELDSCLNELCQRLDKRYKHLMGGAYNEIIDDYNMNLYLRNEWSSFSDAQGAFTGRILSVNRSGVITIETCDNKLKKYSFKEVRFIHKYP